MVIPMLERVFRCVRKIEGPVCAESGGSDSLHMIGQPAIT